MAVQTPIPVRFEDVFPFGAYAFDVSVVEDFDKPQGTNRQQTDKTSGLPLWQVRVLDGDPEARKGQTEVTVKIAADAQPALPDSLPGTPFRPVLFDGMTVTPYVDDRRQRPRVAYSLRATAMRPAKPVAPAKPAA